MTNLKSVMLKRPMQVLDPNAMLSIKGGKNGNGGGSRDGGNSGSGDTGNGNPPDWG